MASSQDLLVSIFRRQAKRRASQHTALDRARRQRTPSAIHWHQIGRRRMRASVPKPDAAPNAPAPIAMLWARQTWEALPLSQRSRSGGY